MDATVQTFAYRTAQGCHVYGHKNTATAEEFITLSADPPPALRILPAYEAQAPDGRSWP